MNTFYEHHRDSIRFGYRCFDRILLNGLIQPFQYRELYPVSKPVLKDIARQYEHWVTARAQAGALRLLPLRTTSDAMTSWTGTSDEPIPIRSSSS